MNKLTLQGISIGTVVGIISAIFVALFHKNLNPAVVAFLPFAIATVAHYFGIRFAVNKAASSKDQ